MQLTKYPPGSLRELGTLAIPLMLSSLSITIMLLADRWFLAQYSITAHNAAVVATVLGWACIFGWVVLANIAEVFVAQFNGAGLRGQMGVPVWQMIWLSLASILFFLPLSLWGSSWIYGSGPETAYERDYFRIMLLFGPFYPLYVALCGFFIGQGKTRLVISVVVAANIVNIILDNILIFGIAGWIPSLGIKGAAIATSFATTIQAVILIFAFFSKNHRQQHGTLLWKIHPQIFWECLKIGLPNAIFMVCEILAFAVFYALMKDLGMHYITVVGICQNMWILFSFFAEGMNKATATVVANLIGAGRSHLVSNVLKAGVKLNIGFFVVMLAGFWLGTPFIIRQFLPTADAAFVTSINSSLETCLCFMAVYMFFEGLRYQFSGVLQAAGDTVFLFVAGSSMVWLLMILPVYVLVVKNNGSVEMAFSLWIFYSAVSSLAYFLRIVQGKWHSIVISQELASRVR